MSTKFKAAKKTYVPHRIVANIGPVTMTFLVSCALLPGHKEMQEKETRGRTTKKLNNQLLAVARPFAGYMGISGVQSPRQYKIRLTARIRKGVISAGYNHVIPSHPTENHELNKNRHSTEMTCAALFPAYTSSYSPARTAIVPPMRIHVESKRFLRPNRSITKMAMEAVRKYEVPFTPAMIRDISPLRPMLSSRTEVR